MTEHRVLLAGATGSIGEVLAPLLIRRGHSVVGLTRTGRGAQQLRDQGAIPVVTDILDRDDLMTKLAGERCDIVIHEATALERTPFMHRDLYKTNTLRDTGTAHLTEAAALVGAHRFLTQSFFLGYGYFDHGHTPITEDKEFAPHQPGAFGRHLDSMRSNERQVLGSQTFEGIALRYGLFYGDDPTTRSLMKMAKSGRLPAPKPAGTISPIHIEDAANATIAAMEHGQAGQAYNIVDDTPIGFDEYIHQLARAVGARTPITVPGMLISPVRYLYGMAVRARVPLSNVKARTDLDWTPTYPSVRDGFKSLTR